MGKGLKRNKGKNKRSKKGRVYKEEGLCNRCDVSVTLFLESIQYSFEKLVSDPTLPNLK